MADVETSELDDEEARAWLWSTMQRHQVIELVRQHQPYAEEFHHDPHELTDLLSYTIGAAPASCPDCVSQRHSASGNAGAPAPAGA